VTTAVNNFDTLLDRRIGPPPITSAVTSWNGMTGDVVGTLVEIWSYGEAHGGNLATNYFSMPSGNLRFNGDVASGALPGTGFFESATTPGDPRTGTDYHRRYYPVSQGIGGFVADQYVGWDPLWNGNFNDLGGVDIQSELIGFSQGTGLQNQPNMAITIGAQHYQAVGGFFDGPITWPIPGSNPGQRADLSIALWNDTVSAVQRRFNANGYGQLYTGPLGTAAGIFAAWDIQADISRQPAAAGNGIGIFVRDGTGDPPKGILDMYLQDGDRTHGWGWEFWASDSNTHLERICSMDWQNGVQFFAPITTAPNAAAEYNSALLDLTVAQTNIPMGVPSRSGYYFVVSAANLILAQISGVATGPLLWSMGNDVGQQNVTAKNHTAALLNTFAPVVPYPLYLASANINVPLADAGPQILGRIQTPIAGVASAHGYLQVIGAWVKI
jgi:hypothetical protein